MAETGQEPGRADAPGIRDRYTGPVRTIQFGEAMGIVHEEPTAGAGTTDERA